MNIRNYIIFSLTLSILCITGCDIWKDECIVDKENRKVLLLYSAGFNSLSRYLYEDIEELKSGWLPGNGCNDDILLVYTHRPKSYGAYNTPANPYLIRLYKDADGKTVSDTLITYEKETVSASAQQLNKVLTFVKDNFTSGSYGMIFSSHATGYLPSGFYSNPDNYTFAGKSMMKSRAFRQMPVPVPYIEPEYAPGTPMVKSIGQDVTGQIGSRLSYEMDLKDFAEAIPMKLDYIIFDACLMGGIEVAYELQGKCGKLGVSQAEVLAEGMVYSSLASHLLKNDIPDPEAVCIDYFTQYEMETGVYQSATISLIDCDKLEGVASACREIFNANRTGLTCINPENVQRYYRSGHHWFYDLESLIIQAGATDSEIATLRNAFDECILYKAHTPKFMLEFDINIFSGFSMYLPCNGTSELDKYYKTLKWNEATGLII